MTKHTAAPWLIGENRYDYDLIIRSANNDPVCSVIYAGYSKTEAKANARLIAAAPELLEALKSVVAFCDEDMQHRVQTSREYDIKTLAKTAIAKATGEQA